MPILKTKRSKWIAGTVAIIVISAGTLIGTPTNGKIRHVPLNMKATSSTADFAAVTPKGIVPSNVLDALLVPSDSTRTGWKNYDQGNGTYDRQVNISVPASFASTKTFYNIVLEDNAWKVLSKRQVANGYQFLALHAGSDGYFWEIGITISGTPSSVPALNSAASNAPASTKNTPVKLRLLQYESA